MNRSRTRRYWIRPSLTEKRASVILEGLRKDDMGLSKEEILQIGYFKSFVRMPFDLFYSLYDMKVQPMLKKKRTRTNFRPRSWIAMLMKIRDPSRPFFAYRYFIRRGVNYRGL